MRVLIVSTNTLPAAPAGPAYVAGAVRQAGHAVAVFDSLLAGDLRRAAVGRTEQPNLRKTG